MSAVRLREVTPEDQWNYVSDLLGQVNILRQPRKTYDPLHIATLADTIAEEGLINEPMVAVLSPRQAGRYIRRLNRMWGTSYSLRQLNKAPDGNYWIVIAGHNRVLAARLIWERGCTSCRETSGQEDGGTCFKRHAIGWEYKERHGITAEEALFAQAAENTYSPPASHEDAEGLYRLYTLCQERYGDKYSMMRFARRAGRSPSTVRAALDFCKTPLPVQEAVADGLISYSVALHLARLQKAGVPAETITGHWLKRAVVFEGKAVEFGREVDKDLAHLRVNQMSVLGDYDIESIQLQSRRRTFEQAAVRAFWENATYMKGVLRGLEAGILGDEAPFSADSPVKAIFAEIDILAKILPHLESVHASRVKIAEAEEVVHRYQALQSEWIYESILDAPVAEREALFRQLTCDVPALRA